MNPVWTAPAGVAAAVAEMAPRGADAGVKKRTITVDGRERAYCLYRPSGQPTEPYPVELVLHGGGGNDLGMRRVGSEPVADWRGFALAYPDSHNRGWNDGRIGARSLKRAARVDDVSFFHALIDRLIPEQFAEPARVHATGVSNGGIMSYLLACELADRVAAVAPVIANMPQDRMNLCKPVRPVPMLILNGVKDPLGALGWRADRRESGRGHRRFGRANDRVVETAERLR